MGVFALSAQLSMDTSVLHKDVSIYGRQGMNKFIFHVQTMHQAHHYSIWVLDLYEMSVVTYCKSRHQCGWISESTLCSHYKNNDVKCNISKNAHKAEQDTVRMYIHVFMVPWACAMHQKQNGFNHWFHYRYITFNLNELYWLNPTLSFYSIYTC